MDRNFRKTEMQPNRSFLHNVRRRIGSEDEGAASGLFDKKSVGVVVYIGDNGVCNEKAKEPNKEDNEDADIQNAAVVKDGGILVDRVYLVEKIIFLRAIVV
jgi:hypothetical protein